MPMLAPCSNDWVIAPSGTPPCTWSIVVPTAAAAACSRSVTSRSSTNRARINAPTTRTTATSTVARKVTRIRTESVTLRTLPMIDHAVPCTPDRLDQRRSPVVELLAQVPHVHLHDVRIPDEVGAPDLCQQLVLRADEVTLTNEV